MCTEAFQDLLPPGECGWSGQVRLARLSYPYSEWTGQRHLPAELVLDPFPAHKKNVDVRKLFNVLFLNLVELLFSKSQIQCKASLKPVLHWVYPTTRKQSTDYSTGFCSKVKSTQGSPFRKLPQFPLCLYCKISQLNEMCLFNLNIIHLNFQCNAKYILHKNQITNLLVYNRSMFQVSYTMLTEH